VSDTIVSLKRQKTRILADLHSSNMNPIICTWHLQLPKSNSVVWPDGCRDLIAIISRTRPPEVLCSGLEGAARPVLCTDETRFVGVRLAPGVTFPWERADPEGMRMDEDFSEHLASSKQHWGFAHDPKAILETLIRTIDSLASSPPSWVSNYFEDLNDGTAGRVSSLSERSVRRQLVKATGAPPKYWSGLGRARKAGLEVSRSEVPLAAVAADNGFSDQAHMSREIRRWFGCTPKSLRANREQAITRFSAPDAFR